MDCSPKRKQGQVGLSGVLPRTKALRRAPKGIAARLPMNNFIHTLLSPCVDAQNTVGEFCASSEITEEQAQLAPLARGPVKVRKTM
jgi:hypothetical protein